MSDDESQKTVAGPASSPDPGESSVVNHWPCLSDEVVVYILSLLPQKDLVNSSLIDRRFMELSRDDSLWTELTLDYVDIKQNAEACKKMVDRCKKLVSLKISNKTDHWSCWSTSNWCWDNIRIMTVVMRAKDKLRNLEFDHSIRQWTPVGIATLVLLQNLASLTISFDCNSCHGNENTYPVMKKVLQNLKKLKKVEIKPITSYDQSLVVALAENNPDLKVLRIRIYPTLSDDTIDVLIKSCPGLEEMILCSSQSKSSIEKLSSSFPKMKRLEISGLAGNMDEKLTKYVETFRSLESLDLSGISYNITNRGIERMVSLAEKLKHLSIPEAPRVTKTFVESLRIKYPDLDLRINNQ